jgi:hypothetical protein
VDVIMKMKSLKLLSSPIGGKSKASALFDSSLLDTIEVGTASGQRKKPRMNRINAKAITSFGREIIAVFVIWDF